MESFRRQLHFQELLRFLFEQNCRSEHAQNPAQSVEDTIGYLQSNYGEPITVRQLAEMARLPQWQYTALFQELTGKKPLDYVTELRINSSKQFLIASQDPLRRSPAKSDSPMNITSTAASGKPRGDAETICPFDEKPDAGNRSDRA